MLSTHVNMTDLQQEEAVRQKLKLDQQRRKRALNLTRSTMGLEQTGGIDVNKLATAVAQYEDLTKAWTDAARAAALAARQAASGGILEGKRKLTAYTLRQYGFKPRNARFLAELYHSGGPRTDKYVAQLVMRHYAPELKVAAAAAAGATALSVGGALALSRHKRALRAAADEDSNQDLNKAWTDVARAAALAARQLGGKAGSVVSGAKRGAKAVIGEGKRLKAHPYRSSLRLSAKAGYRTTSTLSKPLVGFLNKPKVRLAQAALGTGAGVYVGHRYLPKRPGVEDALAVKPADPWKLYAAAKPTD